MVLNPPVLDVGAIDHEHILTHRHGQVEVGQPDQVALDTWTNEQKQVVYI